MYSWLTLRFDGRSFKFLESHLEFLGVELYAPKIWVSHKRPDRPGYTKVEEHLFPGYVFLKVDTHSGHPMAITELSGVYGFVKFGTNEPLAIRQDDIDDIKAAVKAHNDGMRKKGPVVIGGDSPDKAYSIQVNAASNQAFHIIVQQDSSAARVAALNKLQKQTYRQRVHPDGGELERRRSDKLVVAF